MPVGDALEDAEPLAGVVALVVDALVVDEVPLHPAKASSPTAASAVTAWGRIDLIAVTPLLGVWPPD